MKTIKHFFSFLLPMLLVAVVMLSSCSSSTDSKDDKETKEEAVETKQASDNNREGFKTKSADRTDDINVSRSESQPNIKSGKNESIIPYYAMFVANIDFGVIWQKGEFDNLKNLDIVKEMRKEIRQEDPAVDRLLGGFLNNPSSCGINMNENMIFFATQEGRNTIFVFSFLLSSRNDFESFANKISQLDEYGSGFQREYDSDNNVYYSSFEGAVAVYNDDRLLFVFSENDRLSTDYLKNYSIDLLKLNKRDCITQVNSFKEYWNNHGDISIFLMYENISYFAQKNHIDDLIPQNMMNELEHMASYITFSMEKGSVEARINTIGMPESIRGITDNRFNKNIIKYMPEKTFAAVTLSLNPEKIVSFVNEIAGKDSPMNQKAGVRNYKTRDLVNAFGGSIVASFYGMIDDEMPAVALAADITNKEIIKAILEELGFEKNGDFYSNYKNTVKAYLTDNVVVMSTDGALLRKAVNGGYSNSLKDIANKAKEGNYAYVNLNISKYPAQIVDMINKEAFTKYDYYSYTTYLDEEEMRIFYEIMGWFSFADAQLDSNGLVVKIHTADTSTNSLSYLIRKFDRLIINIMNSSNY